MTDKDKIIEYKAANDEIREDLDFSRARFEEGGLTSAEIAEMTDLTNGSVRSALSRSLKKVRGYFE